jgi:hypothetical protein
MNMAQLEGYAGKLARGEVLRSKKLQDESRMIANQTGRFALGLQEELRDSRVAQEKLTTELRQLMLDENKAVSPAKIKDILDKYNADAVTRPFETDAKIAQAEDIIRRGRVGAEKQDLLGGPTGVAAQELTKEELDILQMEANIDRTRGLTDALRTQMELMRNPVDTRITGNADMSIGSKLEDAQKELSRLGSLNTMFKDEDGKTLSISDLLERKPNNEIGLKEEYELSKMSPVDRYNLQLFLSQSGKVEGVQKQMPAELRGYVDLSAFGNEPPQIGQEIEFQGRKARVVSIENGQVKVTYEGTLYEKNIEDINAEKREQARIEQERQNKIRLQQEEYDRYMRSPIITQFQGGRN